MGKERTDMKLTFGQIKFFANQFAKGIPIPLFRDDDINKVINAHIKRIDKIKTRRRHY